MARLAFSYIRFSSKKQELSDSLRRQTELSRRYAAENNLVLSEQSFADLGISAFKSKNSDADSGGGLGLFIRAVEEGVVPNDSYLLVESLDRISRDEIDVAIELLMRICRLGITIVSLNDGQIYSKERIKQDRGVGLIISIASFVRAHEESQIKSSRIGAAWANKRATQKIQTRQCPGWLRVNEDKTAYEVIEEQAYKVRKIFEMSLQGHGTVVTAKRLNALGITTPTGKLWSPENVGMLLKNQAVFGRYVPSKAKNAIPIDDQYPAIIDKQTWDRAQEFLKTRASGRRTKDNQIKNMFAGSMYCAHCGSTMRSVSAVGPDNTYLQCRNSASLGKCEGEKFVYEIVEDALFEQIFSRDKTVFTLRSNNPITDYRQSIIDKQKAMDNLIAMVMRGIDNVQIQDKIKELTLEIERDKKLLEHSPVVSPVDQVYSRAFDLRIKMLNQQKTIKTMVEEKVDDAVLDAARDKLRSYRLRLRAEIKRLVSKVYVAHKKWTDGETIFQRVWYYSDVNDTNPHQLDCWLPPQGLYGSVSKARIRRGGVLTLDKLPMLVNFVEPVVKKSEEEVENS